MHVRSAAVRLLARGAAPVAALLLACTTAGAVQILEGGSDGALFGWSMACADFNGDGKADLLVGAPDTTSSHDHEGAAYIYLATSSGYQTTPWWTKHGGSAEASFGWSVAS